MEALRRYEPLVDDFEAFRDACERPLPTVVRASTIKGDVERAVRAFEDAGIEVTRRDWNPRILEVDTEKPGNTWPYFHGWVHGQEEVSAIPARILDPQPDEAVWDTCAAPGGKSTQLADLMDDSGLVVANDDNLGRLSALRGNADRLGVTSLAVTNEDARRFDPSAVDVDEFDRVLVDAPCTCEGTVRKNPDALDGASPAASRNLGRLQADILRRAVELTKPGGVVVYSTCTFAPEENEAVVDAVLGEFDDLSIEPFDIDLVHDDGLTEWDGETYDESLAHAKRFYPHQNDTGGFFTVKLRA